MSRRLSPLLHPGRARTVSVQIPFGYVVVSISLHNLLEWVKAMMPDHLRQVKAACC